MGDREIDAEMARITSISAEAAARGVTKTLDAEVVESVNVHESIKLGRTVLGLEPRRGDRQLHHHDRNGWAGPA